MRHLAWISAALLALAAPSALSQTASRLPAARGGPTTLDKLTLVQPGSTGPVGDMCAPARAGTACRALKDRASDEINVKDYGAKLDGVTDDYPAFNAARAAAGLHGVVVVPPGGFNLSQTPTAGSPLPILWRLSGNKYGTTTFPVTGIGTDMVTTVGENSIFYGQDNSTHFNAPLLRINQRITHSFQASNDGKNPELVLPAIKVYQFVEPSGPLDDFPWAISTTTRSKAYGKGQLVGLASQMQRPPDALADGKGPRSQLWGAYIEVGDETDRPSNEGGALVGMEMGMFANSGDPNPSRIMIDLGLGRRNGQGVAARVGKGINFGSADGQYGWSKPNHSFFGKVIAVEANFDTAVLDTTGALAIGNAPAIKLADTHRIAFDTGGAHHLRWEAGALRYATPQSELFNIEDDGDVMVAHDLYANGKVRVGTAINIPDQIAPSSTSDPRGEAGDVMYSGQYMFRKTLSGWLRFQGSTF